MFHLTCFLTRIIRFWHFSSAAFIEKNAELWLVRLIVVTNSATFNYRLICLVSVVYLPRYIIKYIARKNAVWGGWGWVGGGGGAPNIMRQYYGNVAMITYTVINL